MAVGRSYFDGDTFGYVGMRLLVALFTILTCGFGYPYAICKFTAWRTRHTVIDGHRLIFTGHAMNLWKQYIKWFFLAIITFGIYALFIPVRAEQWVVSNTVFDTSAPEFHSQTDMDKHIDAEAGGRERNETAQIVRIAIWTLLTATGVVLLWLRGAKSLPLVAIGMVLLVVEAINAH